jgi:transposase-like protein
VKTQKTASERDFLSDLLLAQTAHIVETAIKAEVDDFLNVYGQRLANTASRRVVHNGYSSERPLTTSLGQLRLNVPRLRDRATGQKVRFVSRVVPRYGRKLAVLNASLAWSYLAGLMTGDFRLALSTFLGHFAPPISRGASIRLKKFWLEDYEDFRDLAIDPSAYQFFWAQAATAGPKRKNQTYLVLAGIEPRGRPVFLGLIAGDPAATEPWAALFRLLEERGLTTAPRPVLGAPTLGVWSGLKLVYGQADDYFPPASPERLANVLGRLPLESQSAVEPIFRDLRRTGNFSAVMADLARLAGRLGDHFPKVISILIT